MTVLGPCPCQVCRMPVWWDGKAWVDGTAAYVGDARHVCKVVDGPTKPNALLLSDEPSPDETMAT